MFWDRIVALCAEKNITPNALCKKLNFSNATATHWKKGAIPRDTSMKVIADYFDVTTDYLLGRTDIKEEQPSTSSDNMSEERKELHSLIDRLPPERRQEAAEILKSLIKHSGQK